MNERAFRLPTRQLQVLQGFAEGMTDEEIAAQLRLKPATVKKYVAMVRGTLGVRTRACAMHLAHAMGLLNFGGCHNDEGHPAHWFGAGNAQWCTGRRHTPPWTVD